MKTSIASASDNLLKYDKEIEKENQEGLKLDEILKRLNENVDKNTKLGEQIMSELAALEEERKSNKERLDSRRAAFSTLKKEMQRIEDNE